MVQGHLDTCSVLPEQRTLGRVPSRTEVRWTEWALDSVSYIFGMWSRGREETTTSDVDRA